MAVELVRRCEAEVAVLLPAVIPLQPMAEGGSGLCQSGAVLREQQADWRWRRWLLMLAAAALYFLVLQLAFPNRHEYLAPPHSLSHQQWLQ